MSPKSFAPATTTTTLPKPSSPVVDEEIEIEDDVQDGEDTGFVGADEEAAKNLFLPPTKSPPKPGDKPAQSTATKNQAVDYCSSGRLQNATDIKKLGLETSSTFKIYIPTRENGYGTQQLAHVLDEMGKKVNELLPGSKLAVGAISSKNGGKQKGHKSHQNGNDADLSYLVNNSRLEFKSVTAKDGVQAALLVPENWALFKFAFSTGKVEMIFIDSKIKRALCQEAILKGDLKDSKDRSEIYSILSLIRVTPGHDDHFHLRVKCGRDNPLCKTRRYKNLDSGCFVASK
jgi:penicillin-insensitive murein endopeptidase